LTINLLDVCETSPPPPFVHITFVSNLRKYLVFTSALLPLPNKTVNLHDLTEILLKVVFNITYKTKTSYIVVNLTMEGLIK